MTELTKFGHSCIRLDDGDRTLVFDPGMFSESDAALDGASAIVITHEHPDHVDPAAIRAAATRDPRVRIWAPAVVAETFADLGEQVVTTEPGQDFDAAGFAVRTFGGQHALIHPAIPVVPNIGYLVDGAVYHPGDSFAVPAAGVRVLLLPLHAPWSKTAEVIDFAIAVGAARAFGIHDALLADAGRGLVESLVGRIAGEHGVEYAPLTAAVSV